MKSQCPDEHNWRATSACDHRACGQLSLGCRAVGRKSKHGQQNTKGFSSISRNSQKIFWNRASNKARQKGLGVRTMAKHFDFNAYGWTFSCVKFLHFSEPQFPRWPFKGNGLSWDNLVKRLMTGTRCDGPWYPWYGTGAGCVCMHTCHRRVQREAGASGATVCWHCASCSTEKKQGLLNGYHIPAAVWPVPVRGPGMFQSTL